MTPLSFVPVEQRFGYGAPDRLDGEPFAKLATPNRSQRPVPPTVPQAELPDAIPVPLARPAADTGAEDRQAALPTYDEATDPAVTAVLLPDVTSADIDRTYRTGEDGKIVLPPMARLPIIETDSAREALASD